MKRHRLCGIGLIFLASLLSTNVWALSISPASVTFTGVQGGSNPVNQTVVISKSNKRGVNWNASDNAPWLSVTPASGVLNESAQITLSVNTSGLGPGTYTGVVTVQANKGGSVSLPVSLNITAPPSTTSNPPSPGVTNSATLTWSANQETDLAGYKVYVGNAPGAYGAPIVLGMQTSYIATNLQLGHTYYFAVSAYDTSGNESALSAIASKSIY